MPGGAYSIPKAPKISEGNMKQKKFVPGVGQYSPEKVRSIDRKSPSYSLPKAIKKITHELNSTPGVGLYNDQSPTVKRRNPAFQVGLKTETDFQKFLRKEKRPGPANYDPFSTSLSKIGYTMGSKNDLNQSKSKMTVTI